MSDDKCLKKLEERVSVLEERLQQDGLVLVSKDDLLSMLDLKNSSESLKREKDLLSASYEAAYSYYRTGTDDFTIVAAVKNKNGEKDA